jgi:hypothetical protein
MLSHCDFISFNSPNELFASVRNKGSRLVFLLGCFSAGFRKEWSVAFALSGCYCPSEISACPISSIFKFVTDVRQIRHNVTRLSSFVFSNSLYSV